MEFEGKNEVRKNVIRSNDPVKSPKHFKQEGKGSVGKEILFHFLLCKGCTSTFMNTK